MQTKLKKEEHKLFSELSQEWWDENGKFKILHQIRPIRIEYILKQIKDKKIENLDILDLGCGGGLVSESLSRLGANVTGIDFVKKNIEVAKSHARIKKLKINYLCRDIEKTYVKKKFDLIIMFEILEHLDNWKMFLSNIKNNLRPNGTIIISTINRNFLANLMAIHIGENILKWIPKKTHDYQKFIKPIEIRQCMEKNNLFFLDLKGLVFNPIENNWKLSSFTGVNYFCSYRNQS